MMTENEKKIKQWCNERVNRGYFRSQADYNDNNAKKDEIQLGVLRGDYPNVTAAALTIRIKLGFSPAQSQVLAGKYWMQKQGLASGRSAEDLGIPSRIAEKI